jgi:hypothetical protein
LSAAGKSIQTEYYPISNFTSYNGSNNLLATYPLNWQILKLSTGYQIPNLSSARISLAATTSGVISLIGVSANNNFDKAVLINADTSKLSASLLYGYSRYFNGTGDYIQYTAAPGNLSSTFTIECWMNSNTISVREVALATQSIAAFTPVGMWRFSLAGGISDAKLYFNVSNGASFDDLAVSTNPVSIHDGKWHHIAYSCINNSISAYVDGVYVGSNTITKSLSSNQKLNIGYNGTDNVYYTGYLSNVRIVHNSALYTANFTPSASPLTNVTGTQLLTLQSDFFSKDNVLKDYSNNNYSPLSVFGNFIGNNYYHIGGSIKLSATEVRTITADTISLNDLYVHNQGVLTFPLTSNKTLTLNGSAGLQITSDGTLNIGTSS